jgi:hypothetical protein
MLENKKAIGFSVQIENKNCLNFLIFIYLNKRDAPEATGEEGDDADFEMPKVYEPVSYFFSNNYT